MGIPLRILLIEDSERDATLLLHELSCGGYAPASRLVQTPDELNAALDQQEWDVVLSDYSMPQFDGMAALKIVRDRQPSLPFIVISGKIGEETAAAAMKAGANDYLMKDRLGRLTLSVQREIQESQDRRTVELALRVAAGERRRAEAEMRDSVLRYRSLVLATSQAIWSTNADGEFVNDQPSWRALTGQTEEQQLGRHWFDAIYVDDRDRVARWWGQSIRRGEQCECEFRLHAADGTLRDIMARGVPIRGDDGNIREWIGACSDITEHKRMEQVRAHFETIVHCSDDAIISKAPDGIITSWNVGAERIFGYTADEAIGKPMQMLIPPDRIDEEKEILDRLERGKHVDHFETVRLRKDGRRVDISVSISLIKDSNGRTIGAAKIARDITEHKCMERILLENQRELERKNQRLAEFYQTAQRFVDNVSHEFRTPLTVIKGYAEVVQEEMAGPVNEQQKEFLGFILDRSRDLAQMVDDLLDSSKLRAGTLRINRRPHYIEDILTQVRPMIAAKAAGNKIELIEEIDSGLPEVFVDSEKVGRIILNLAVNAIKFSSQGSRITIWARRVAGGLAEIGITDFGPGISPENLQLIFDRFKQVGDAQNGTTKGFGLGLNIARELVAINLGEIHVDSTLGEGSTFSFTVPTTDAAVLLQRYLEYLDKLSSFDETICLFRITRMSPDDMTDEVRGLIASIVRPTELLLDGPTANSLLLIGCTSDVDGWLQRFRGCAPTSLKDSIEIELLASWHYPDEKVLAEMGILESLRMEPVHV